MSSPVPGATEAPKLAEWLPADKSGPATRLVRPALLVIALVALAAGVVIALQSLLAVVELWFQPQYVPIARAVLGLGVVALALVVLRMLLRRPAA